MKLIQDAVVDFIVRCGKEGKSEFRDSLKVAVASFCFKCLEQI